MLRFLHCTVPINFYRNHHAGFEIDKTILTCLNKRQSYPLRNVRRSDRLKKDIDKLRFLKPTMQLYIIYLFTTP